MQRLYSTFARGGPGIGLLLLRVVLGLVVLWYAGLRLLAGSSIHLSVVYGLMACAGVLLIAGLWTALASAVVAAVPVLEIVGAGEPAVARLLAATMAGALILLGPGRWSVDARLFGWRRIDAPLHRK